MQKTAVNEANNLFFAYIKVFATTTIATVTIIVVTTTSTTIIITITIATTIITIATATTKYDMNCLHQ